MSPPAGERPPSGPSSVHFCRHEFKYRLPRGLASTVRACVAAHLPLDPYSAASDDGYYDISSLYLDSADLRLCRESMDGVKNRFKLRVRGYDDHPDHPVFLEIKRRINTIIVKDRSRISRSDLATLATPGGTLPDAAARQFSLYRQMLSARPQALVRYRREAFEGSRPNRVRITFDRDLTCRTTDQWRVEVQPGLWRRVLADEVVVEIKFDGATFPAWVQDIVRRFQLQARSVSKYCLGLHACTPTAIGYLRRAGVG